MYNQISQSIAEDNYPVRMAGYYAGVWGFGGRSHNCINDLAFMRALPNFNVFAASDYWEAKTLVKKVAELDAPSYIDFQEYLHQLCMIQNLNFYHLENIKMETIAQFFAMVQCFMKHFKHV